MANKSFPLTLIIGIALMVAGAGLAYWGYDLSQGWEAKLSQKLSGRYSDKEMMLFIGAAICFITGLVTTLKK